MCSASSREPPKLALLASGNPYTREAHITCEENITPEGHITFRLRNTSLKKDQLTCELVFFLSMGYEKDIFTVFAYEFELSQFLVKYRLTPK